MPVTVRNADILFNDSSTQNKAVYPVSEMVANAVNSIRAFSKQTQNTTALPNYTEGNSYTGTDLQGSTLAGTWRVMSRPTLSGFNTYTAVSGDDQVTINDRYYVLLAVRIA